jgi:tetratricopeptide (TPR) repeat protein
VLHTGMVALALVALGLLDTSPALAGSVKRGPVRAGNKAYHHGDYEKAFSLYREALGDTTRPPKDAQGVFYNGGNALYMEGKYGPAVDYYQRSYSPDSLLTGRMLYNRGNALLKGGRAKEAIESYIQSLQYLPDDEDARHNLELALAMNQQQQQQQQKQQGDQNDKNQQQDQNQQSQSDSTSSDSQQQPKDGDKNDEQQKQQPDSTQAQSQPDSTRAEPQPADSTMAPLTEEQMRQLSPEDAMRILQALEDREQELQKERRKAAFRKLKRTGKDW